MYKLPKVVLFDFDGTLIESGEIVVEAYHSGMINLGYHPKDRTYIATLAGLSTFNTGRALGIKEEDLEKIDLHFWDYFANYANSIDTATTLPKILPGVENFLNLLKINKITMGVVTSNEAKSAKIILDKLNLLHYFDVVIGKEHCLNKKPDPEPLFQALDQLKFNDEISNINIWYVGDTQYDVQAAKSAGILSIGIPTPHTKQLLEMSNPEIYLDTMQMLIDLIEL